MLFRVLGIACLSAITALPLTAQAVAVSSNQRQATALPERISVAFENTPLADAIWTIARRSGTNITFNGRMLPTKLVTYKADGVAPDIALTVVLKGTGLRAVRGENEILELVKATPKILGVITGKVTDVKTGKGISGATISVGNQTPGVTTGEDGSYRLTGVAARSHTVTVRLVGYAKQTRSVTVGEAATVTVDFKLEPSASVLNEIVVTGTVVSTELKAVPNAITVITAKQIEERGITRIDQLFRGEIPGLFSLEMGSATNLGNPSLDEVVMYSRGATKISTNTTDAVGITNPIKTYVDGVELADAQYLSQIDPKSIERIEILAGPQASTIYGANAINGVMQIFTKRGSTMRPSTTLSLAEGFAQNNFTSAVSPSHQYDGSVSGVESKISYNVGASWNYAGAWTPGKQSQRTSIYGGTRYQSGAFSLDLSARQGWTKNNQRGSADQVTTALAQEGEWRYAGNSGLIDPAKRSLSGRTLGAMLGYTPFSWWSHQVNMGSDASDAETLRLAAGFSTPDDTTFNNNQSPNSRVSQSYSSTLRIPIASLAQATLTYGVDHWRSRDAFISWTTRPSGELADPFVESSIPTTSKNRGAYIQGQFGLWDALFLTYGVRADWAPVYGEKAKVRPGRYGMSYARDFGVVSAKLRGSYGRSIRPPTAGLIEGSLVLPSTTGNVNNLAFYGAPLYSSLPSPELGPEFQQGGEGGIELYLGNRGSLVITRYNQTVDGLISSIAVDSVRALQPGLGSVSVTGCSLTINTPSNRPRSDGYCYRPQSQNLNIGSIRNQGWEMQGSVNLGSFTTRGTYSWVKSRVIGVTPKYKALLADEVFSPGQSFNYVPEHTWAMNVSYARHSTSVSLNVNGLGQILQEGNLTSVTSSQLRLRTEESYNFTLGNTGIRLPRSGYTTANMNASHRFSEKVEATLQITNLTNYYQNDISWSAPTLGRQTRTGLRIRM